MRDSLVVEVLFYYRQVCNVESWLNFNSIQFLFLQIRQNAVRNGTIFIFDYIYSVIICKLARPKITSTSPSHCNTLKYRFQLNGL